MPKKIYLKDEIKKFNLKKRQKHMIVVMRSELTTQKANTKKQRSKILNKKSFTMKPRSNNLKEE